MSRKKTHREKRNVKDSTGALNINVKQWNKRPLNPSRWIFLFIKKNIDLEHEES